MSKLKTKTKKVNSVRTKFVDVSEKFKGGKRLKAKMMVQARHNFVDVRFIHGPKVKGGITFCFANVQSVAELADWIADHQGKIGKILYDLCKK